MQVLCLYIDRENLSQDWRVNYANSNILWHFLTAIIWHTWWFFWQIQKCICYSTVFAFFFFFNLGQFPSRSPRGFVFGGAIYRRVFCVTSLGGLYLEGLIFVILLYLARESSEMFRHLEVTTETAQPRPPGLLGERFNNLAMTSFWTYRKILPNLVDNSWLWWIMLGILANRKRRNTLN